MKLVELLKLQKDFAKQMSKLSHVKKRCSSNGESGNARKTENSLDLCRVRSGIQRAIAGAAPGIYGCFCMGLFRYGRVGSPFLLAPHQLEKNAVSTKQSRYHMNPNHAKQVKEELDWLLNVGFIVLIENLEWISPPTRISSLQTSEKLQLKSKKIVEKI